MQLVHVRPGEGKGIVCGVEEEDEKACDSPLTPLITDEEDSEELCCKFPGSRCRVCRTLSALYYRGAAPCDAHTHTQTRVDEREREQQAAAIFASLILSFGASHCCLKQLLTVHGFLCLRPASNTRMRKRRADASRPSHISAAWRS